MDLAKNIKELTQLAHKQPTDAARTLALALKSALDNDDKAELVRVATVVKELAKPLTSKFEPLVFYASAVTKWADGDINGAIFEFKSLRRTGNRFKPGCYSVTLSKKHGCLKITDVLLDMPAEIFERVAEIFEPVIPSGGHFSTIHTKITDAEILKTTLTELGFKVKTNAEVRGYMGQKVPADIVAVLKGDCDLGWSRNSNGTFDLICDVGGVSEMYDQNELINSINKQYSSKKT